MGLSGGGRNNEYFTSVVRLVLADDGLTTESEVKLIKALAN